MIDALIFDCDSVTQHGQVGKKEFMLQHQHQCGYGCGCGTGALAGLTGLTDGFQTYF